MSAPALYFFYLVFALLPIAFWMVFYFKKDLNPEPKSMIAKVFLFGIFAGCVSALLEIYLLQVLDYFFPDLILQMPFLFLFLQTFVIIASVEELAKYLVVKFSVLKSPELDEPLDIMLYMAISALGFVTVENIIVFFAAEHPYAFFDALNFAFLRFFSAIFLHTLTSSSIGFFMALYFCFPNKKIFLPLGFILAIGLHGLYNFSILEFSGLWQYLLPVLIIIGLAIFTTFGFIKLRKIKSICIDV